MENSYTALSDITLGETCIIKNLNTKGLMKRRLLDLGFIKGTIIKPIFISPSGDPVAYLVRKTVIALRHEISSTIIVEKV